MRRSLVLSRITLTYTAFTELPPSTCRLIPHSKHHPSLLMSSHRSSSSSIKSTSSPRSSSSITNGHLLLLRTLSHPSPLLQSHRSQSITMNPNTATFSRSTYGFILRLIRARSPTHGASFARTHPVPHTQQSPSIPPRSLDSALFSHRAYCSHYYGPHHRLSFERRYAIYHITLNTFCTHGLSSFLAPERDGTNSKRRKNPC
jgi:hypothetical protein